MGILGITSLGNCKLVSRGMFLLAKVVVHFLSSGSK